MKKINYNFAYAGNKAMFSQMNLPNVNVKNPNSDNFNSRKPKQSEQNNCIEQAKEEKVTPKYKDEGMLESVGETITDIIGDK